MANPSPAKEFPTNSAMFPAYRHCAPVQSEQQVGSVSDISRHIGTHESLSIVTQCINQEITYEIDMGLFCPRLIQVAIGIHSRSKEIIR